MLSFEYRVCLECRNRHRVSVLVVTFRMEGLGFRVWDLGIRV